MIDALKFPEELFTITNKENYYKLVNHGLSIAKEKRILFTGICRNVGENLQRNILRIKETAKNFQDYKIFIYENDSTDNTVDILKNNCDNKFHYISESRNDSDYVEKLERGEDKEQYNRCKVLANCRNKYLEFIEANKSEFDIVCVLDLDIFGGWSYEGFLHGLSVLFDKQENGAVTSYGILSHYTNKFDLEEIDRKSYIMYDCFVFRPINKEHEIPGDVSVYNFIKQNPGDNPIIVNSNFNGLGIYKIDALLGSSYDAIHKDGYIVDADHVVLHKQMRDKEWKIIFNPSTIVSYAHHKYSRIPLDK